MRARTDKENGMITVEAVLSLIPFILVILGLISFINIFLVHNKIQFAIYQIGNELSCYTYFYQALGIRDADKKFNEDIDENTETLDNMIEQVNQFMSQLGAIEDSLDSMDMDSLVKQGEAALKTGQEVGQTAGELISDPQMLLREVVFMAFEKTEETMKDKLIEIISEYMIEAYLDTGFSNYQSMSADEYLRYFGVREGEDGRLLDFSNSSIFDKEHNLRTIDIVVEYDIEVYFFKLFLKDPTIHVVQRCMVPAWLDGDGRTYNK